MSLPVVALVGRPNVGKSSLLNKIARRRVSIVEPTPGVTRDRVSVTVEVEGQPIQVMDTGGIGLFDETQLKESVQSQIEMALLEADLLLFVVDALDGMTPMDQEVAQRLRKAGKKVVLVANKTESARAMREVFSFIRLGFGDPYCISALAGFGIPELMEAIIPLLPKEGEEMAALEPLMKVAVVGKRNAGKSSLINYLAGEERVIVSELPGTTRDAVDVLFKMDGRRLLAIDTAGLRKRTSVQDAIEFFSLTRSQKAVLRADVVLFLFDVSEPLSRVDKQLSQFLIEHHKPVVIGAAKWDLAGYKTEPKDWENYIRNELSGLSFAPVSFFSVKESFHVRETISLCWDLFEQAKLRIKTGEMNRVLKAAFEKVTPKARKGPKALKIFYATQVDICPPTIVLFVNDPALFSKDYGRFLQNQLRQVFSFSEIPIKLICRKREKVELPPQDDGSRKRKRS